MSLYDILQVQKNATLAQIKSQWKLLSNQLHPDKKTGDTEKFKELENAYAILKDKAKREHYDQTGEVDRLNEKDRHATNLLLNELFALFGQFNYQQTDYISALKTNLYQSIQEGKKENQKLVSSSKRIKKLVTCFKGKDIIAFLNKELSYRIESIETNNEAMTTYKRAIELIDEMGFEYNGDKDTVKPWDKEGANAILSYQPDLFSEDETELNG